MGLESCAQAVRKNGKRDDEDLVTRSQKRGMGWMGEIYWMREIMKWSCREVIEEKVIAE